MEWRGLPTELLVEIVGLAIQLPSWPLHDFLPPAPSRDGFKGFALANRKCYSLYASFANDAVYFDDQKPLDEQIEKLSPFTKHLFVTSLGEIQTSAGRIDLTEKFWNKLENFQNLQSLSLPSDLDLRNCLPVVKRCHIRYFRPGCLPVVKNFSSKEHYILNAFPNLAELYICAVPTLNSNPHNLRSVSANNPMNGVGYCIPTEQADFSPDIYIKLCAGLKSLRTLRIDVGMEHFHDIADATMGHAMGREPHTLMIGQERPEFYVCEICISQINTAKIVKREDAITLELARELEALQEVCWLDARQWQSNHLDGRGQRWINIERRVGEITLRRPSTVDGIRLKSSATTNY